MTDTRGRFVTVNPAFCKISGFTASELRRRHWLSITHPQDRKRNMAFSRPAYAGKLENFVIEKRYVRKDGSTVWVRNSTSVIRDDSGKPKNFLALVEDITERKRAEQVVRELSAGLLRAEDRERRRIGRELHDSIGQNLAGLIMTLAALRNALSSSTPRERAALRTSIGMARQAIAELRTISYLLHPPSLDDFGLAVALRSYVRGFDARSGIKTTVQLPKRLPRLPIDMELALFRIVQECLNNVRQHSDSRTASVTLRVAKHSLTLQVRDSGRGFRNGIDRANGKKPILGVGIAGMRERLQQFGGELHIHSTGKGTLVTAKLPVNERL